jgi:hypothetical protein
MRKIILIVLLVGAATACSPEQQRAWWRWFHRDPQAATEWVRNECGALCVDDWDHDGVVEPEPSAEAEPPAEGYTPASADEPDVSGGQDTGGVYWPWTALAECESGGNWSADTGNGYYGGLQFSWGSWSAVGGSGNPAHASPSEQVYRAERLQDIQGWGAWPTCSRIIGL